MKVGRGNVIVSIFANIPVPSVESPEEPDNRSTAAVHRLFHTGTGNRNADDVTQMSVEDTSAYTCTCGKNSSVHSLFMWWSGMEHCHSSCSRSTDRLCRRLHAVGPTSASLLAGPFTHAAFCLRSCPDTHELRSSQG